MSVLTVILAVILYLSANWTFSLWCVLLIKSGSLNWPWSTKMCKFIGQSDIKHIMRSQINKITSVLNISTDIITNIPACPTELATILAIMSVPTFKIAVILYVLLTWFTNSFKYEKKNLYLPYSLFAVKWLTSDKNNF